MCTSEGSAFGTANELLLRAVSGDLGRGDGDSVRIDSAEWDDAVRAATTRHAALALTCDVRDPLGCVSGLRWGSASIVITPYAPTRPLKVSIEIAQPYLDLLSSTNELLDLVQAAIRGLDISRGEGSVGRTQRRPNWLTLLDEAELAAIGGLGHLVETKLFCDVRPVDSPSGPVVWLQATAEPEEYGTEHAHQVGAMLSDL